MPGLAFRVGVTGHRWLPAKRLNELRDGLRALLEHIQSKVAEVGMQHGSVYAEKGKATLVLVSPLALGADRLVAGEAVSLGYKLDVPTPYDLTESDPEITDEASPLRALYQGARAHFVLDGIRGDNQAYVEVGRRVVDNSDLLIAFWDGRSAAGAGGTADIVRMAREHDIPVVHFHTERSGPITLWAGPDPVQVPTIEGLLAGVTRLLELALVPPGADEELESHQSLNLLRKYFKERNPAPFWRLVIGKAYAVVTGAIATSMSIPTLPADCVSASREAWRQDWKVAQLPAAMTDQVEHKLLHHFAWANHLSILYAIRYRSAFFWIYLLAILAVGAVVISHKHDVAAVDLRARQQAAECGATGMSPAVDCAALGAALKHQKHIARGWTGAELAILLTIVGLFGRGRLGKYHEKWVDYRSLAERIRHLSFLMPLGTTSPAIRVPVPAQHADPSSTWLNWLFRAIVRQAGLFQAKVDQTYLDHCRALLEEHILRGQAAYHRRLGARLGALHRRLHRFTIGLFVAAVVISAFHYFHIEWATWDPQLPFVLAVLLPTIGAAIHGFLSQGDFENVALRAESAHEQLVRLSEEVETLYLTPPKRRLEIALAIRRDQIAALDRESLIELARRVVHERLDPTQEPVVEAAVPDLEQRLTEWDATVLRLDDGALRTILETRPLREFPPAASAELGRYARHVADIMGDDLIGWRADSQVRPLVLA
ncbi:MAG: hypothetical protein ACREL3_12680 [Gemmatimonadales bacterium]